MAGFGDLALAFAGGAAKQINEDVDRESAARLKMQARRKELQMQQKMRLEESKYARDTIGWEKEQALLKNLESAGDNVALQQYYIAEHKGIDKGAFIAMQKQGNKVGALTYQQQYGKYAPTANVSTADEALRFDETETTLHKLFGKPKRAEQPVRMAQVEEDTGPKRVWGGEEEIDWSMFQENKPVEINGQLFLYNNETGNYDRKLDARTKTAAKDNRMVQEGGIYFWAEGPNAGERVRAGVDIPKDVVKSDIDLDKGVATVIVRDQETGQLGTELLPIKGFEKYKKIGPPIKTSFINDGDQSGFAILNEDGTSHFVKTDGAPADAEEIFRLEAEAKDDEGNTTKTWIFGKVVDGKFVESDIRTLDTGTKDARQRDAETQAATPQQVEQQLSDLRNDPVLGEYFKGLPKDKQDRAGRFVADEELAMRKEPAWASQSASARRAEAKLRWKRSIRREENLAAIRQAQTNPIQPAQ